MTNKQILDLLKSHTEVLEELSEFQGGWEDDIEETKLLIERVKSAEEEEETYKEKLKVLLESLEAKNPEEMVENWSLENFSNYGKIYVIAVLEAMGADPKEIAFRTLALALSQHKKNG